MKWRTIKSHPHYQVSSCGQVRHKGGDPIGQWKNDQGYLVVRLSNPRMMYRVHRLVAEAFIPNPNKFPVVNHIDHRKRNNRAENLEWCTQKHNLTHAAKAGRMQKDYWKGRRSPNAKLSDEAVIKIRILYATGEHSWESLGKFFGVSKRAIGRAIHKETYSNVR